MISFRTLYSTCALLALSAGPGFATVVTYNDLTSWQNATLSGFNVDTFDSVNAPFGSNKPFTTGLTLGDGVAFYGYNGASPYLAVWNEPQGSGQWYNFGSGPLLVGPTYIGGATVPYINISLPAPATSVAFDVMSISGAGVGFSATLNGGGTIYTSAPTVPWSSSNPQPTFWGFTSDLPITSIQLSLPFSGITPGLDNFRYGTADTGGGATDTPEACTMLLIGLGLTGMAGLRRRLSRIASALRPRPAALKPQTN